MDKKNYYFLLELSIDPPENDPKVIDDAIQKKQALWSRLRNHPTKGTQAQQYMDLLPEIRNVMTDDALRLKEAREAQQVSVEQEKETNAKLDRHIALLLSKGRITGEEISKLAQLNAVSEKRIQERVAKNKRQFLINYKIEELIRTGKTDPRYHRSLAKEFSFEPDKIREGIQKKEQKKYKKIDSYLKRCNRRGYVTRQEIVALSRLYLVAEDNITRRTRCVIKKSGSPMEDRPEPLDKSTENIIEDNLTIVEKSSLYDFLNVPPGSDLDVLQASAHEKDAEVRKIGNKDAVTTASGTLVGYCIYIFKNEKNRSAYDRTLTLSRLQELNSDMDVSAISKKIHAEYVSILMKSALKLGMDVDEARLYIKKYIKKKRLKIQKPKPFIERRRPFFLRPVTIIAAIVVLVATAFFMITTRRNQLTREFKDTLAFAEKIQPLEKKETVFRQFLEKHPDSDFTSDVEERILDIQRLIENRDYNKTLAESEKFYQNGNFNEARAALTAHMKNYPKGLHEKEIENKISAINSAAEDRYYEAFKIKLDTCIAQEAWGKCILLCDHYIKKYPESKHAEKAKALKKNYTEIVQSQADLKYMKHQAEEKGNDFEAARRIYLDYLEANPERPSIIKKAIVDEIELYDKKIETFNQAEKEWTFLVANIPNDHENISVRIRQVKAFIEKYPPEWYGEEAEYLLAHLEKQKSLKTKQVQTEREIQDWKALTAYAQANEASLSNRISKVEEYIRKYPNGNYTQKARIILLSLKKHKEIEDAHLRQKKNDIVRRQEEGRRISTMLKRIGGSFIDNENGTVTDKRTGLMWCMFDAYFIGNKCVNYREAIQYVKRLKTGGYSDWRLPEVEELQLILQTQPLFPANRSHFFWSSELFWHGWNEMAYIFTPTRAAEWQKASAGVEKCGSVLAVRR